MKLKGLVWFFTIALILISLWELSYTWVVRSYEGKVREQATRLVKAQTANMTPDQREEVIKEKTQYILDSTKEKEIFPIVGTTYQKCKEYELNLGLDLQGGMGVTMDVNLEGLLKSLSNNSKDSALLKAIATANSKKVNSEDNYVDLFTKEYIAQNGAGKLASLFSGPSKEVKASDDDKTATSKLKEIAKGAINQTYKILQKRIDKFGVAQPNINLDENKGVINVELAGITNPERVRKFLQSSANLQFWSVVLLKDQNFQKSFADADKALAKYLKGTADTTNLSDSAKAKIDSAATGIIGSVLQFPIDQKSGQLYETPYIGMVAKKDTGLLNSYIKNEVFASTLGSNVKLLYGVEQKGKGGSFFEVYAIEKANGSEKAPLEGEGVAEASQGYDDKGKPSIKMQMTPTGAITWANLTEKNNQRYVAISLDDIVYSAPRVNGKIEGGNTEISGSFTVEEAQDLANILKSGKLDAPAKIVADQVVGPTLGKEAVNGGATAFIIAFAVIFILMLVYYNTGGWVANIALILNLLFTIGVLAMFGFTLTAAGIAGLVLTIGLAVDTNVIIFERIKEELTKGKNYQAAISEGYKRSLAPVLDAHITSLLTAFILLFFGLGPVLGFATTQIIGILLSLFCGIMVSRLITDLRTDKNHHFKYFTAISSKIFKHASYKFIEKRKIAYAISAVVLLVGVASFFNGFREGVEFKGGRSFNLEFAQQVKNTDVQDDLAKAFGDEFPVIKTVKDGKHLNITTSYLIDNTSDSTDVLVQKALFKGLTKVLPAGATYEEFMKKNFQGRTTVQPSISDDLKRGAIKATIFAMLIIFVYIFIRFRDWRYSAGTIITLIHDVLVTLAVFSFFKDIVPFPLEIDQHFIAAILTVIGFSMNDTVIVFDRIREYSRDMKGATKTTIINKAINDTLSRTIMTSLTVFITLLILFIFGGEVTKGFAFAMMIGVITGTYSSIFVGAPVLVDFAKDKPLGAAAEIKKKVKAPEL
ncbi:protein translocase subunit SecDF [Ferruginibacter yonginensis]|uniref:Multifunctional fusion protein n=1 Tax=Ferruginibacter yonginensis TaxID=1310416 RepID=A0ABV8QMY1_9BACT